MSRAITDTRLDRLFRDAGDVLERHERAGLTRDLTQYADDPVGFALDVLHVVPWSKQIEIMDSVLREPRVSVKGGVGTGKDFTAAVLALWWAYCRGGLVIITAASQRQVREILFGKEIRRLFHAGRLPGEMLEGAVRPPDRLGGIIGFTSNDVNRLTGYHGAAVLCILSEAQGLEEDSFEAMKSCAVGDGDRILAVGNPTRLLGPFYATQRPGSQWHKISISVLEHPNLVENRTVIPGGPERGWVERARSEDGEGSRFWLTRVTAESFPTENAEALFKREWLDAAVIRPRKALGPHEYVLALDPARFGPDSSCCAVLTDDAITALHVWRGADAMQSVAMVEQICSELGLVRADGGINRKDKVTVVVDVTGGGPGPGIADRLRQLGYNAIDFHSNDRPEVPVAGEERVLNRRAEGWYALRNALRQGELTLPNDPLLMEELCAITVEQDKRDRAKIVSKIELRAGLGRSPDRADAVMMAVGGLGGATVGGAVGNFGF
jgi:phage terminase large subunit